MYNTKLLSFNVSVIENCSLLQAKIVVDNITVELLYFRKTALQYQNNDQSYLYNEPKGYINLHFYDNMAINFNG